MTAILLRPTKKYFHTSRCRNGDISAHWIVNRLWRSYGAAERCPNGSTFLSERVTNSSHIFSFCVAADLQLMKNCSITRVKDINRSTSLARAYRPAGKAWNKTGNLTYTGTDPIHWPTHNCACTGAARVCFF